MNYDSLLTITIFFVLLNAWLDYKFRKKTAHKKTYSKARLYKSFADLVISILFVAVVLCDLLYDHLTLFLSGALIIVFMYYVGDTLYVMRNLNRLKQS